MTDEYNPETIIVNADGLVPQVNQADIPTAPPDGITDIVEVNTAAIDAGANHVYTATFANYDNAEDVEQDLMARVVTAVRILHLAAVPEWTALETYHEKAVDAALRIRLKLIELLLQEKLLLEHLERLRGPGLSLN